MPIKGIIDLTKLIISLLMIGFPIYVSFRLYELITRRSLND